MSKLRFRDSDKSINYSTDDFSTLKEYHNSFFDATKTSKLRMAICPGSYKYFNKNIVLPEENYNVNYTNKNTNNNTDYSFISYR